MGLGQDELMSGTWRGSDEEEEDLEHPFQTVGEPDHELYCRRRKKQRYLAPL